ncbi:MAG: pilus assembly protein N-terminal domain-containing protein, partial [Steroidobacteraceae bacterium]
MKLLAPAWAVRLTLFRSAPGYFVVAVLVSLFGSVRSGAAEPRAQAVSNAQRIELYVGDTRLLDARARRIAVGNGRVLSVTEVDGRQLL